MFIKLTSTMDDKTTLLNADHIVRIEPYMDQTGEQRSHIDMLSPYFHLTVKESIDTIMAMVPLPLGVIK